MRELLRADFRRILKDKLLIVMIIVAVAFALITPLLYAFLMTEETMESMLASFVSAKAQFFQSFSLGNNLGLIAPIFVALVLCKDFSQGTVRNKIIAGKSRGQIFFSLFIVCSVTMVGVMLLHGFATLGVSLCFFDYQSTPFVWSDLGYFMISLLFEILVLLFASALMSWLCAAMKNVGLVIVLYEAVTFGLAMIGSITQIVFQYLENSGGSESVAEVLSVLDRINVANAVLYIGAGSSYSLEEVLYLILPSLCCGIAFFLLGYFKMKRKDLK